jgi:hypothetical protein
VYVKGSGFDKASAEEDVGRWERLDVIVESFVEAKKAAVHF